MFFSRAIGKQLRRAVLLYKQPSIGHPPLLVFFNTKYDVQDCTILCHAHPFFGGFAGVAYRIESLECQLLSLLEGIRFKSEACTI